ncbi:MAG: DUF1566 domain-containing protein [Gammaproteobacteria bacterium]|nr:DUF1566 domain-containing protein [Gammaproteobacteria bacterium]
MKNFRIMSSIVVVLLIALLSLSAAAHADDDSDSDDGGKRGPRGYVGATGPQGKQGQKGQKGKRGPRGYVGATGPQGEQGETGPTGADGAVGATGSQGTAGNNGADGAQGPAGPQGTAGPTGAQGDKGDTGADGAVGATGPQGIQGVAGSDGSDGAPGADGADGADGVDGAVGATGPQGIQGVAGSDGSDGAPGADGADGVDGADGAVGATGADGLSRQGPQGEPGTSSWTDGIETVSTTGSVQIGSDSADGTSDCNADNEGTLRFNTTTKMFEGCDGTTWETLILSHSYAIGDTGPAGGKVFHITNDGLHGLEAALEDQDGGSGVPWGCAGTDISGADESTVGTGLQNTADILAGCNDTRTAARIADAYRLGGYDDWFLPSRAELNLLYQKKSVVGGFVSEIYWSSTEKDSNSAWYQYFGNDSQVFYGKQNPVRVRAVRAF